VLDDYHLIRDDRVHDSVEYLLQHLPEGVHLAIATRSDPPLPLGRLRARGEMTELRAAELRLSTERLRPCSALRSGWIWTPPTWRDW
jgi:LuxR family maltose regulon positive regulatory protein